MLRKMASGKSKYGQRNADKSSVMSKIDTTQRTAEIGIATRTFIKRNIRINKKNQ